MCYLKSNLDLAVRLFGRIHPHSWQLPAAKIGLNKRAFIFQTPALVNNGILKKLGAHASANGRHNNNSFASHFSHPQSLAIRLACARARGVQEARTANSPTLVYLTRLNWRRTACCSLSQRKLKPLSASQLRDFGTQRRARYLTAISASFKYNNNARPPVERD